MRATDQAAGLDLYSVNDYVLPSMSQVRVATDVIVELPVGTCGMISGRSGLAFNHSIFAFNGIIDSDYRGGVVILLCNQSSKEYRVNAGDRIAQLICLPIVLPIISGGVPLTYTKRGANGFSSTGY